MQEAGNTKEPFCSRPLSVPCNAWWTVQVLRVQKTKIRWNPKCCVVLWLEPCFSLAAEQLSWPHEVSASALGIAALSRSLLIKKQVVEVACLHASNPPQIIVRWDLHQDLSYVFTVFTTQASIHCNSWPLKLTMLLLPNRLAVCALGVLPGEVG